MEILLSRSVQGANMETQYVSRWNYSGHKISTKEKREDVRSIFLSVGVIETPQGKVTWGEKGSFGKHFRVTFHR